MSAKPIEIGAYVLATKYADGDPQDHFVVGYFTGTLPKSGGDRYMVADAEGRQFRGNGFRRIKVVSPEVGAEIVRRMPEIGASSYSAWHWERLISRDIAKAKSGAP